MNHHRMRQFIRAALSFLMAFVVLTAHAQDVEKRDQDLLPGEIFRDCADCPELVVIPPGEFIMGSNEARTEAPTRTINFERPFAVGRHEVTFAEWDACFEAKGCKYRPNDNGWGRGNLPVIGVSWDDGQEFVTWLSTKSRRVYRLLTEAEWEYSSRAGTPFAYWWGRSVVPDLANCQ